MRTREDWLCKQLENDNLSAELQAEYEAELDDIASKRTVSEVKVKELKAQEEIRRAEMRAKILSGDQDLIATLGQDEFGSDYDIAKEGDNYVLHSKVAKFHQEARRIHVSLEEAQADLRCLLYDRLYSKYVRSGEIDALGELKCG